LKKVLTTLLKVFGVPRSDSAPGELCPPFPPRDAPVCIHSRGALPPGLWSRKSRHPTPTPGNFDYPTPSPTPTPDRLRPSAVLVTQNDNSFQMNS